MQANRQEWIEVSGFSIGASRSEDGTASRAVITPLTIDAEPSAASTKIFEGVVTGRHYQSVRLDIAQEVGAGGKLEAVAYWEIEDAQITRFHSSTEPVGEDEFVVREQFDITPIGTATYGYNSFDDNGNMTGNVETTWQVEAGKVSSTSTGTVSGFRFLTSEDGICGASAGLLLAGDYNANAVVDAADYTLWRDFLGAPAGTLLNDSDGGTVGTAQYDTWKTRFGEAAGSLNAQLEKQVTIPEPASAALCLAALFFVNRRGRK